MSIQAVAWALEQELPARPKLVLVAIANHADHTSGYCWLAAETIAREASCSSRAVFNFVGDLIRNGYVRKQLRVGDDGKQRANDYYILLDRDPDREWNSDRSAPIAADDGEGADTISSEPHAPGASPEDCGQNPQSGEEHAPGAVGPHASMCMRKSLAEPSKTNPEKGARAKRLASAPRSYRPPPVVTQPQGATHQITNERVFVYRGTKAWDAWMAHRKRTTGINSCPTYRKFVDGVGWREGWDFPSLFPLEPQATSPPMQPSESDLREFDKL